MAHIISSDDEVIVAASGCVFSKRLNDEASGWVELRAAAAELRIGSKVETLGLGLGGAQLAHLDNQKRIHLFSRRDSGWAWTRTIDVGKQGTVVRFEGEDWLLLGDRTGDVRRIALSDKAKELESRLGQMEGAGEEEKEVVEEGRDVKKTFEGRVAFGHLSVLLDLATLSAKGRRLVASADRDEKIRLSHFPNAYNVHAYCLAHTQYIQSLDVVRSSADDSDILLSGSGDGSVKTWNTDTASVISSVSLSSAEANVGAGDSKRRLGIRKVSLFSSQKRVAVLTQGSHLFTLSVSGKGELGEPSSVPRTAWTKLWGVCSSGDGFLSVGLDASGTGAVELWSEEGGVWVAKSISLPESLAQNIASAVDETPPLEKAVKCGNLESYEAQKNAKRAKLDQKNAENQTA